MMTCVGCYDKDSISGGTGDDVVLGGDGLIFSYRVSSAHTETLYDVALFNRSDPNLFISTPGEIQQATVNVGGELIKMVDLTPYSTAEAVNQMIYRPSNFDDIIYGSFGNDLLRGGAGNDLVSGTEALTQSYFALFSPNTPEAFDVVRSDYTRPYNPGNALAYGGRHAGEFAAYDEYAPMVRIVLKVHGNAKSYLCFSNFSAGEGATTSICSDGNDRLYGAVSNDWVVGGTAKHHAYSGWGDDLINMDGDHTTAGGLNNQPNTAAAYEDVAYRSDVLIAA